MYILLIIHNKNSVSVNLYVYIYIKTFIIYDTQLALKIPHLVGVFINDSLIKEFAMADYLMLLLPILIACSAATVVVRVAIDGSDDPTCLHGGVCNNLTLALKHIQDKNSSTVYISPGQYTLLSSTNITFNEISDLTIAGNGIVEIDCGNKKSGLSFIASSNINITGVTFKGCGVEHISTSLNFDSSDRRDHLTFYAGLYFEQCSNVHLASIAITDSTGIAVQFYYSLHVSIINSNFSNNIGSSNQEGESSGGVYIEFPYCLPGELCIETTVPYDYVSNTQYYISGCHFTNNIANNVLSNTRLILPYNRYHLAFGQGGGLSVFFKGHSSNIEFVIEGNTFSNNKAQYGGAVYIDMQDNSHNNTVIFRGQNTLTDNKADISGGAAYISFVFLSEAGDVSNSRYILDNVIFSSNDALHGGGLYYLSTRQPTGSALNSLSISNCHWARNTAKLGAALHLSAFSPVDEGMLEVVSITNSSFIDSALTPIKGHVGTGAVFVEEIPVKFYESANFINTTDGTALVVFGTKVIFAEDTTVFFYNNSGHDGGAIALYSLAFIKLFSGTSFEFTNNSATDHGGAIYVEHIGLLVQNTSRNCFIRFHDITISPYEWNANFIFNGNTANKKPNSIYATSVLSCILGRGYGLFNDNSIDNVFCWNNELVTQWEYNSQTDTATCKSQIVTGIDFLKNNYSNEGSRLQVIPGKRTPMELLARDNQYENVTENLVVQARSDTPGISIDSSFNYISNNEIVLYRMNEEVHNCTVILDTIGDNVIRTTLAVEFQDCPPGLHVMNGNCVCEGEFGGIITCEEGEYYTQILRGFWIGKFNDQTVVGHCRNCDFDQSTTGRIKLNTSLADISNDLLCGPYRTGVLCSVCKEGYNPVLNLDDFSCAECTSAGPGISVFIIVDIIFPIVLLAIIYFSNIPLTSGIFHGPILFGQMITTVILLDADDIITYERVPGVNAIAVDVIEKIYTTCYDFFNLEVFMSFQNLCLSPNIKNYATIIALHYIPAYLPLAIVTFFAMIYYCKERSNCLEHFRFPTITCPKNLKAYTPSLKKAPKILAAFILLSYTKTAIITVYLLTPVSLRSANDDTSDSSGSVLYLDGNITYLSADGYGLSRDYIPYFIFAIFMGLPFLIAIPLCLCCFRPSESPETNPEGFFNHLLYQFQQEFRAIPEDLPSYDQPRRAEPDEHPQTTMSINDADQPEKKWFKFKERRSANHSICDYACFTPTALFNLKVSESRWWKLPFYMNWSRYDFRWLAGGLFILRLLLIIPYIIAWNVIIQYILQFVICLLASVAIILIRPYKQSKYKYAINPNVIEASSFLLLALIIAFCMYQYFYTITDVPLSTWGYVVQIILVFIPLLYIIIAGTVLIILQFKECCHRNRETASVAVDPGLADNTKPLLDKAT